MFANIGTIIDRLQAHGSFVVLIGIRGPSLVGDANAKGFKTLAREKSVMYVPNILDGILSHPSLMSDYIHPNDAGYAKIAERLEKELRPLMPRIESGIAANKNAALKARRINQFLVAYGEE
jgi:hypothetical protein